MIIEEDTKEYLTLLEGKNIFNKLVPSNIGKHSKYDEILGKLSYTQYIIQKYQYIEKSKQDNGVYPTEDEIRTIISYFGNHGEALSVLKTQAAAELQEYTDELLFERTEEIIVKHKSFWGSVFASIVAAFIYSIIISLIIFTITVGMPDTKLSRITTILFEKNSKVDSTFNYEPKN